MGWVYFIYFNVRLSLSKTTTMWERDRKLVTNTHVRVVIMGWLGMECISSYHINDPHMVRGQQSTNLVLPPLKNILQSQM